MIDELPCDGRALAACLVDARERVLAMLADLGDEELLPAPSPIINPFLWELGHIAWFQEYWTLRHLGGKPSILDVADELYDSAAVAHDTRWQISLRDRVGTLAFASGVLERVLARLARATLDERELYFHRLVLFHEDMHTEALLYMRQTLGYPRPDAVARDGEEADAPGAALRGDVEHAGGTFLLGARPETPFVLDNEQWSHEVELRPFALARAPVTQAEFSVFVEERGYARRELWSEEGWRWRERTGANHPLYWGALAAGRWQRRSFERWIPLEPHLPVHHVSAHEADAYCRWASRRLPSEAEWECAASTGGHPWPETGPARGRANLDLHRLSPLPVDHHALESRTPDCRQMVGNVWEWTASAFLPYPGFEPGPYREYSAPWFGDHRVLRGGSFATRSRLLWRTWRNFYKPARRDIFAGFRTAALTDR